MLQTRNLKNQAVNPFGQTCDLSGTSEMPINRDFPATLVMTATQKQAIYELTEELILNQLNTLGHVTAEEMTSFEELARSIICFN